MTRDTTIIKQKIVIDRFHQLLRSGKDYTTNYMYQEAGKPAFMSEEGAGAIIRSYYRGIINEKMVTCVSELENNTRNERVEIFSKKFRLCEREARLMIRYIRRRKTVDILEASEYE